MRSPTLTSNHLPAFSPEGVLELFGHATSEILTYSPAPNAQYAPRDLWAQLCRAALENVSVDTLHHVDGGPSADLFSYYLQALDLPELEARLNHALEDLSTRGPRPRQAVTLALDRTDRPFYGDPTWAYAVPGRRKASTRYFVSFLAVSVCHAQARYVVRIHLLQKPDLSRLYPIIEEMIAAVQRHWNINRVLFDRGFSAGAMSQLCRRRGLHFITPVKQRQRLAHAMNAYERWYHRRFRVEPPLIRVQGNQVKVGRWQKPYWYQLPEMPLHRAPEPVRVAVVKLAPAKPASGIPCRRLAYYTTLKDHPKRIQESYGRRWGIETQFRETLPFLSPTSSKTPVWRLLLYGVAVLLYNVLVLALAWLQVWIRRCAPRPREQTRRRHLWRTAPFRTLKQARIWLRKVFKLSPGGDW